MLDQVATSKTHKQGMLFNPRLKLAAYLTDM